MPPHTRAFAAALLVTVATLLAGCGGGATPSPGASQGQSPAASPAASASTSDEPSAVPSPSASAAPTAPSPSVGTTDTEWGRIWDAVPASFPIYTGARPVDPDTPASLAYDAPAPVATVTSELQAQLETAGFSTLALSGPFEDGSSVIDSTGEPAGCLVQTTIAPLGTTTRVTVLYGVGCPPG